MVYNLGIKSEDEKEIVGRQLHDDHGHGHSLEGIDRLMGISLVLGFVFMMFVEQLATYMSGSNGNRIPATDAEALVQSSGIIDHAMNCLKLKSDYEN